jgi:hypothetical protein
MPLTSIWCAFFYDLLINNFSHILSIYSTNFLPYAKNNIFESTLLNITMDFSKTYSI